MFVKKITINNFRGFREFEIDNLSIPNKRKEGSGLTVFVGENGIGKSSLLAAFALTMNMTACQKFGRNNFYNIKKDIEIDCYSESVFSFWANDGFQKSHFDAEGAAFFAKVTGDKVAHNQLLIKTNGRGRRGRHSDKITFKEGVALFLQGDVFSKMVYGDYSPSGVEGLASYLSHEYINCAGINIFAASNYLKRSTISVDVRGVYDKATKEFEELLSSNSLPKRKMSKFSDSPSENYKNRKKTPVVNMGSGYGIVFSLLFFFGMAKQSRRKLIVIIDEPEMHLHPRPMNGIVKVLLKLSKSAQVILASHSPLLVKQLLQSGSVDDSNIRMLKKDDKNGKVFEVKEEEGKEKPVLPYVSADEVNYVAFDLATEGYYRELYEGLKYNYEEEHDKGDLPCQKFDDVFLAKHADQDMPSKVSTRGQKLNPKMKLVTKYTYLRHLIHHTRNPAGSAYLQKNLRPFIEELRALFPKHKK